MYSSGWILSIFGTNDHQMTGCVTRNYLWAWPLSSRSFSSYFAIKLLKYGTSCPVSKTLLWNWQNMCSTHGSHACRDFGKKSGIVICDSRPGNSREFHLFCLEFGKMRASEFFLKLKWSGFPRVLISGKSPYFQLLPSRPWKSPYFWIFSIEVRQKVLIFNRCVKTWMINIVLRKLRFSKCCGNDVELFGNPSDPLTNHRWRVVWRHLVPAKIPRASFIKFYYVVTLSQSADTWCHVVVVRNLIGPQSRRYTWRTLRKTSSIFVEIRQHT